MTATRARSCYVCNESWSALMASHCGACHRLFESVALMDLHRPPPEHACTDPAQLGMVQDQSRMWRGEPDLPDAVLSNRMIGYTAWYRTRSGQLRAVRAIATARRADSSMYCRHESGSTQWVRGQDLIDLDPVADGHHPWVYQMYLESGELWNLT